MRLINSVILFIGLLFFMPQIVSAQIWLKDRETGEGPGFKVGRSLVLHVGLGAELGADSNVMYKNDPVPAGRFRVTPYIDLATRSPARLENNKQAVQHSMPKALFRFGVAAFYDRYFGSNSEQFKKFHSKTNPLSVNSHLDFSILPERKVSLFGGFTYLKTLEPYESSSDAQSKHNIVPSLGLRIMPGGGMLTIEPKYRMDLLVFDDPRVAVNYNRVAHETSLSTNWKIFPKTAIISNVIFRPTIYFGNYSLNVDSLPLRSWIGAQGLIFERFGFRALLGYGVAFYDIGPDFEGIIGDLALMFHLSEVSHFTIGAKRDFADSFYANYYVMTGPYMSLERMFAGRFLVTAEGNIYKRNYAEYDGIKQGDDFFTYANTNNREDVWITASFLAELRVRSWLSFHMSLKIWSDITDFAYTTTVESMELTEEHFVEFSKAEFMVGARAHF